MGTTLAEGGVAAHVQEGVRRGYTIQLLRPYSADEVTPRYATYYESAVGGKAAYKAGASDSELTQFLDEQRKANFLPRLVAASVQGDSVRYTAVCLPKPEGWDWLIDRGLTTDDLKTTTADRGRSGFRPQSVTAYAWDGAVRYCVVWVKEPPKPVPYPKDKTLVTQDGYETLLDATKEQMQAWLDEKKKAKQSVLWLDVVEVAGKPLYSAVAALDDRQADWVALLQTPAADFGDRAVFKQVPTEKYHPISLSGFSDGKRVLAAGLWHPGKMMFFVSPDGTLPELAQLGPLIDPKSIIVRAFRPYPVPNGVRETVVARQAVGERKGNYAHDLSREQLEAFVAARRKDSEQVLQVAAYPNEGVLRYAAVGAANPDKLAWEVDTDIPTSGVQQKVADRARAGYRPASVTAYPWDGVVRYCVVWVKYTPKKEDKKPPVEKK
jgi:hypothetical protein